ncbi:outer membrane usher protein [Serratia fonticola]|uniref:outer membrane usher protein n=1 Tax=Serratia fonticola TaxID=47917 RepID=UPI00093970D5|nr:outer membrane usher protein [Serratia fonticola]OKP31387.1 fimbrial assembly protein [Serratia fonticola]
MVSLLFITRYFRPHILSLHVAYCLGGITLAAQADDIQFNTDILDVKDRANIDLGQFSRSGYIMPGEYLLTVYVNKHQLSEQSVTFYTSADKEQDTEACVTPEIVKLLGLKPATLDKLTWQRESVCLALSQLPGMTVKGDLGSSTLYISMPQAYLEYVDENWDPPSRWDEGIPGLLADYSLNAQAQRQQGSKERNGGNSVSSNGTIGANMGVWRLRADWQSQYTNQSGSEGSTQKSWDWSRYYAYRAVPSLSAKLMLGETFLTSDIFDSFRFTGASLITDDSMLPPSLRGYAPEVTGLARTNAKVTISQEGRVLYETHVAPGPFRIQDINNSTIGQILVRVEESDGRVETFTVNTANVPYLTRPGTVRYKVAAGRPSSWQHQPNGSPFTTGEFSWGVSNGWSLYGGGVAGGNYNALALGVGRDLMMFGALSFDVTQSRAKLPQKDDTLSGGSYRLSYSKRFDEYNSQVTFAGYRFSERDFMSMSEYLDARTYGARSASSKEMYTLTFNKQFVDLGISAFLNYTHLTYWNSAENNTYNLTLSRNFDLGRFKDLSILVTAYRNQYNGTRQDGMYLSLSIPWGHSGSMSYNGSLEGSNNTNQVSVSDQINGNDRYQLAAGSSRSGATASGYYTHQGSLAQMNGFASYQHGAYSSAGLTLQGGATATHKGAALHRTNILGGTRILIDTDGVANVPIQGHGAKTSSNYFGKAVVVDVGNYYRNQVNIDLDALPDSMEATNSVVQATLTEGAIGYRRFEVITGEKAMAVVRLADGSTPPFGANVLNKKMKQVGIVGDSGSVYLSGINAGDQMEVHWNGRAQCVFMLPNMLSNSSLTDLLLPCRLVESDKTPTAVAAK